MVSGQYYFQRGFALPIAIMLGLMFMVIGASVLVRSQSDNATASAQRGNLRGLNAAEIGVGRFQSLMNQHRGITTYPAFSTGSSWSKATAIPTLSSSCTGNPVTEVKAAATDPMDWKLIDPNDASKGTYRLVSYTYDAIQKAGTLVVEGQVGAASNPSITRLEVKIPVVTTADTVPGLWVKESLQPGAGTINANIWGPCTGTFVNPSGGDYTMKRTALEIPTPPTAPSITPLASQPSTLPRLTDPIPAPDANGNVIYEYVIPNLSDALTITPGKKVNLWVQGNIDLQGGETIQHQCSTTPDPCSPFDAKVYGMAVNGTLTLSGNAAICDVIIWAPTYGVEMNGGGQAQGCGGGANNNGIYWVKSWLDNGGGNHVALDQGSASWDEAPIQPLSKIEPIASWRREQTK
jgi:hypothetical protein